jgi:hypothetical protein
MALTFAGMRFSAPLSFWAHFGLQIAGEGKKCHSTELSIRTHDPDAFFWRPLSFLR